VQARRVKHFQFLYVQYIGWNAGDYLSIGLLQNFANFTTGHGEGKFVAVSTVWSYTVIILETASLS